MDILNQVINYVPFNQQETKDRELIIRYLQHYKDIFDRSNDVMHMTASAWITNRERTKILMCYHNIYNSFSWLGGHADGDKDLLRVALREVKEESGLSNIRPLSEDIFSLEILPVSGHEKKGEYIPSHLHINVTYLIEADSEEPLTIKEDENKALKWYDLDKVIDSSNEQWFKERIYSKLNDKLKRMIGETI